MDKDTVASLKQKYPNIFEHFKAIMTEEIIAEGIQEFDSKSHEELMIIAMEDVVSRVLLERTASAIGNLMSAFGASSDQEQPEKDDVPKA
jgi:heterodisulfide reductase subunit A-like polyferredoxin